MTTQNITQEQRTLYLTKMNVAVRKYLKENNISRFGGREILNKFFIFAFATAVLYTCILVFPEINKYIRNVIFYGGIGLNFAFIGFTVMHDASHGTFSENKNLNQLMLHTLEIMGASSILWIIKHVDIHHNKTNTVDDDDLNSWPVLRLHSSDTPLWFHKYQHFYGPVVYCLLFIIWIYVNDYVKYFRMQIKNRKIKTEEIKLKDHIVFWAGKIIHPTIFIVVPSFYIGIENALIGYFGFLCTICGFSISFIFQLAHVVESTEEIGETEIEKAYSFMERQIRTTSNFSTGNKWVTFFTGGLNFQIEHHLFAHISHVHYPKIQHIVQEYVKLAELEYKELTILNAFVSHEIELKDLGTRKQTLLVK